MQFTESELLEIQFPRSEHYCLSATYSAALTMGMRAGPVQVSLHADVDALIALYGVDTNLPLWKIIGNLPILGYADESLAPPIAKGQVAMPTAVAYVSSGCKLIHSSD